MAQHVPDPRKGMPDVQLDEAEFKRRFRAQYVAPAFDAIQDALEAAWQGYANSRKAPRTHKAGRHFRLPAVFCLKAAPPLSGPGHNGSDPSCPQGTS